MKRNFRLFFNRDSSLFFLLLISLFINILSLAMPFSLLHTYDRILPNQSYDTATILFVGVVTAVLLEGFLRYFRSWMMASAAANFELKVSKEVVTSLFKSDYKLVANMNVGRIFNGVSAIGHMRDMYSGQAKVALIDLPFACLFLWLVYFIGGNLVFIPIAVWVVVTLMILFLGRKLTKLTKSLSLTESQRTRIFIRVFSGLTSVKALAQEAHLSASFRTTNYQLQQQQKRVDWLSIRLQECIGGASQATTLLIIMLGALLVIDGHMTTGGLTACSILAGRAVAPLSAIIGLYTRVASAEVAKEEVLELINIPEAKFSGKVKLDERLKSDVISFDGVKMPVASKLLSLDDIALPEKSLIQVTSDSLYFASEALSMMVGLEPPTEGEVRIGENNIYDLEYEAYRDGVVLVSAWPNLFSGTLLENMTMFTPELEADAMQMADRLGLTATLAELPSGYQTRIDESGIETFNKGTIKLIALVRALVQDPAFLMLEQPFLSLDIPSAELVAQVLQEEKHQRSIFTTGYLSPQSLQYDHILRIDATGEGKLLTNPAINEQGNA
ncbi:ABC transporter transmembrane domain-containing protein [Vibrio neonatus]|uniref:ABC transporter transmembrane domain-containing protein n=2 Tax=Vibrio neonatus TaxID=278860 RepID=UPI0039F13B05